MAELAATADAASVLTATAVTPAAAGQQGVRTFLRSGASRHATTPMAVLLDRHCTLLRAVCATSAARDQLSPLVHPSLDEVRASGGRVGVASHNRADDWEAFDMEEIAAMCRRIEAALGRIDLWCICLVDATGRCACDSPLANPVATGARDLGMEPHDIAVATDDARLTSSARRAGAANLLGGSGDARTRRGPRLVLEAGKLAAGAADLVARARRVAGDDGGTRR